MRAFHAPAPLLIPLLLPLGLVTACTVGPDYQGPPPLGGSGDQARQQFVRASDPAFETRPGLADWWKSLNDPLLNSLIADALAHSPNIDMAQARIREANARLDLQKAGRLPSVDGSAVYAHARLPDSLGLSSSEMDIYGLSATASWEPDLFGGTRRELQQSAATAQQRFDDLADAQVSLSARLASAYVSLREAQTRQRLNARSADLQQEALALTEQRFKAGTASALDVEQFQNQLDNIHAQTLPIKAEVDEYMDQIAVLSGKAPGSLDAQLADDKAVPMPPQQVPIGDPATLIAHRPDIRAAERALAASTAGIGVAQAQRLPQLKFNGVLGLGGTKASDMFDSDSLMAVLAPMLSWSFLDFGRGKAHVLQSEAQRDEADAQYRETVLEALQDAETSLSRFGHTRAQLAQLLRVEASAQRSVALNQQRLDAGTSTRIQQLGLERDQLTARSNVVAAQAQLTNDYIAVQKSLGLGWQEMPASSASASEDTATGSDQGSGQAADQATQGAKG